MGGYIVICLLVVCLMSTVASLRRDQRGDMPTYKADSGIFNSVCPASVIANANRLFGVDLYNKVRSESGGENIILSPFSISAALAMTLAGARGETKSQMMDALRFSTVPYCNVHLAFLELLTTLSSSSYNDAISIVNGLFVELRFSLLESYEEFTSHYYGALVKRIPFDSQPETCRQYINDWVKWKTDGQIVDLLPPGSVMPGVVVILGNAITFKGLWEHDFSKFWTTRTRFYQSTTRYVDMMHLSCTSSFLQYAYVRSIRSQVVELPYKDVNVSMYIVLPASGVQLSYVEERFSWDPNTLRLTTQFVSVSLPKFSVTKDTLLTPILKELGMVDLFAENGADLGGIAGAEKQLWVNDVFHQAYVKVHEAGTEASAATAVVVCEKPPLKRSVPVQFVANRPFLFFIWDHGTNSLLFCGRFRG